MLIPVANLNNIQLNYAMAHLLMKTGSTIIISNNKYIQVKHKNSTSKILDYCNDWERMGRLIEANRISFQEIYSGEQWQAYIFKDRKLMSTGEGSTHLLAAVRCILSHCVGDNIEIPTELL